MRDYYQQFVRRYSANTYNDEPTKPTKGSFVGFVGWFHSESAKNSSGGNPDLGPDQHPEWDEICEERVAIMMYDGGLSEAEAIKYVKAKLNSNCLANDP